MRTAVILVDGVVKAGPMLYHDAVQEYKKIQHGGAWKELAILETSYRHRLIAAPTTTEPKTSKKAK